MEIPEPTAPVSTQADAGEAVRAWLSSLSRHPDLLSAYQHALPDDLDAGVLLPPVVHCVAAFPDVALDHYSRQLKDPKGSYESRALALDHLSVLARRGDPEVRRLFLATLKSEDARLRERAAAWTGRYYSGEEVRNALLACALNGSDAARLALSHERGLDPVMLGLKDPAEKGTGAVVRGRLDLLSAPDYRLRLGEALKDPRQLSADRPKEALLWAVDCVGRLETRELAESVRGAALGFGVPTATGPAEWSYWEMQRDQEDVARAIRALDRLGVATALERRYLAEYGWTGDRDAARRAILARRNERHYREMARWLGP